MANTAQIARMMSLRQPSVFVGSSADFRFFNGQGSVIVDAPSGNLAASQTISNGDTILAIVDVQDDLGASVPASLTLTDNKGNVYNLVKELQNVPLGLDVYFFKASGVTGGSNVVFTVNVGGPSLYTIGLRYVVVTGGSTEIEQEGTIHAGNVIALPALTTLNKFVLVCVIEDPAPNGNPYSSFSIAPAGYTPLAQVSGARQMALFYGRNPPALPVVTLVGTGTVIDYFFVAQSL
jgi:hypothetical protein